MTKTENEVRRARLADRINEQHQLVQESARRTLTHIVKLGLLLSRVKREVRHGHFILWVESHCTFCHRTAQIYMQVAEHRKELKAKSISYLTGAIKQLQQSNSPKKKGQKKDTDLEDDLAALSKTLVTARTLMQRIEKKRGWQFWRRGNKGLLARVEESATALTKMLNERFSIKSP